MTVDERVVAILAGIHEDGLQNPTLFDRMLELLLRHRIDLSAGIEPLLDDDT